jgi:hypothetical protein
MKNTKININLPPDFNQVLILVKQLPYKEKLKLSNILKEETGQETDIDKIQTHFASEKVLTKDWLLPQEDEAWKDL